MSEFREDSQAASVRLDGVETATDETTISETATDETTISETATDETTISETATDEAIFGEIAACETTVDIIASAKDAQHECESECCSRRKVRSEKEYKDLMNRLSRVEGQIRGIKRMLEEDAYCIDIINQVSAANCALNSFCKVILANHIRSCVAEDIKEGGDEKLDELVKTLQKLMK